MGLDRNNKEQQMEWDLHELDVVLPIEFTNDLNPDLFGLNQETAKDMVSGLNVTFEEREVLKKAYIDIIELPINTENLLVFKELRLKIVKNRTQGIEKWHKTNKEFYLSGGRFVDAIKNKEILVNQEMEEKLLEAEKFFENQEKERVAKLQSERIEKVSPYLESVDNLDLTTMDDYVFDAFYEGSKAKFEAKKEAERLESERIENERIAEAKRLEEQKLENEKLKKEAEIKEIELAKERAENEAKQKAILDEADKKALEEKLKQDAIIKAEQEKTAKLTAELQAKKEAEIKAENDRIEADKSAKLEADKLAKAPIKKQMLVWVDSFTHGEVIQNETSKDILLKFEAFKNWAKSEIDKL